MTLKQLEAQLAEMPDRLDVPLRQLDDYDAKRSALQARIRTRRSTEATLAELNPQIATLTKWRDHLVSWRKTLCDQLLTCPSQARVGYELSITRIDRGLDLMG